ncbi:CYTH domain-containing protein [Candidatus Parcubacteria bacterium]|nr:CYTH domain-containing protein [Patescibacteria group bacterium]MCG2688625.1 CYTH domain-containing protein [Candidatus Parcubacteria bacterium]
MQIELEAKFLDINIEELRSLLKKEKAVLVHRERLMKRMVFDYQDARLKKIGGWIRVRDEGDKITLAYKQLKDRTIKGTKEISLSVESFEKISDLLLTIGFNSKSYQETKRERWQLGEIEITIDTWPWIPSFVEIEGSKENDLKKVADSLKLDWTKALHGSVENAYQAYYDVTEEEIDGWERITFIPVPDWLEVRRK